MFQRWIQLPVELQNTGIFRSLGPTGVWNHLYNVIQNSQWFSTEALRPPNIYANILVAHFTAFELFWSLSGLKIKISQTYFGVFLKALLLYSYLFVDFMLFLFIVCAKKNEKSLAVH